jgi:hypothetical protein
MRLGLFTGSWLGKYGQSPLGKGIKFNTVPSSIDAGEWAGRSIAFIANDFTFHDHSMHVIDHSAVSAHHARAQICSVYICFRYDKSKANFIIRKFQGLDHPIFNPVDAIVSIFRRAQFLPVPTEEPLGVFSTNSSSYKFLKDTSICKVMCHACCLA